MKKRPVEVSIHELEEIIDAYLNPGPCVNYALKIVGHPGVGKSALVKQAAEKHNCYFIDTRLAFKENVDLGGYPVPDPAEQRMVYYRPKFIPPAEVPEGYDGVVWFLDESNRAHPTVIQTLFQIITDKKCGEHSLPQRTYILLAGNLGEEDSTTITDFDDSALDGRLAVFQLKPSAEDWLRWAHRERIHPAILHYISLFPEKLWDEQNINPNPRGWHQASQAMSVSYGLKDEDELRRYLSEKSSTTLEKVIVSLVGHVAGADFISQVTHPREITTGDVLSGNSEKLNRMREGAIPSEDVLWGISGALSYLREKNILIGGNLDETDLRELANVLMFVGYSRADRRLSFFYILLKVCGLFSRIPAALGTIGDERTRVDLKERFARMLGD